MNIKTLTGPSIQAALGEARRIFGDAVVLLESAAATDTEPARIRVAADRPLPQATPAPRHHAPIPADPGFGYAAVAARPGKAEEKTSVPNRVINSDSLPSSVPTGTAEGVFSSTPQAGGDGMSTAQPSSFRNRLFPASPAEAALAAPPVETPLATLEQLLESQLQTLHERMAAMEQRFGEAVIGAGHRWAAHPLYTTLLSQGMRPGTATRLFEDLAQQGFMPEASAQDLHWPLAQALRRAIGSEAPKLSTGTIMLLGPSGSGKTSLLLKLATHASFFARRNTTVLVIRPEDEEGVAYQNPTELYRRFGLPVQSIQTQEELKEALGRVQQFDQILIDTPPMPLRDAAAHQMLRRLKQLVAPIMPLQVHLVVNTTRALEDFNPNFLRRLPIRPEMVSLTHLDETTGWGRVADWLVSLETPVRFVSTGPRVPDDILAFSPSWFVENMMQL